MRRGRGLLAAGAASALLAAGAAGAAQWIIDDDSPADFRFIQAAIDAPYVLSGDTLLVRPGRYYGNVLLESKDLVIRSEAGSFVTILDAQQAGSVVSLVDRTAATRLEGFTLTGGRDQTGGGLWIYGGAPVITRNLIEGNSAVGGFLGYGYGGGIEVYASAPVIRFNVIRGNTALDGGGGIDVYYAGPSTPGSCCPVIERNTIVGNSVQATNGTGGGILSFASEPRVAWSILAGNRAALGGGIYVVKPQGIGDAPDADSNVLYGNAPTEADADGAWRLPSTNLIADPRLGQGERLDVWPRSDSPAIDAAGTAPTGPDLGGFPAAADGDLNGSALPDIGALENRSEITGLSLAHDAIRGASAVLSWNESTNTSVRFNVYVRDGDPFRLDGGICLAPGLAATTYTDDPSPATGRIRYYLITGQTTIEGSRGYRSDGTERPSSPSCLGQ